MIGLNTLRPTGELAFARAGGRVIIYPGGVGYGVERYVDPTGSDARDGLSWTTPFATIQAAVDASVSGQGDRIYIMPGTYDENVVIEGKDYLSLIGVLPGGYARPDIVPAAGKAISVIASHGVTLQHLRAVSADDDAVHMEGNGFLIDDCVLDGDGNGATDALLRLRGNADDDSYTASEGIVRAVLFRGSGGYGLAFDTGDAPENGVGSTHCLIERCRFLDNTGIDIMALDTGGGTYAVQAAVIRDNTFEGPKNKTTWIDVETNLAATNTGVIAGNFFADDALDSTAVKMIGSGFVFVGNFDTVGVQDGSNFD